MAPNMSFVLVPGMCSVASVVYAPLIDYLSSKHKISESCLLPVDLPSCDAIATKANLKPSALHMDIATIRSVIVSQLDLGHDVLLVAHSYGGTPSLCAAEGLWKSQRSSSGNSNGVVRIALISSSLSLPGYSIAGDRQSWKEANPSSTMSDEGARMEQHGDEYFIVPDTIDKVWMSDLPSDHSLRKSLRPSALSGAMTPAPPTTPSEWKLSYLVTTEQDNAMPEEFQMWLVGRAREAGAQVDVKKVRSGHFVQVSHVEEVGQWMMAMV